MTILLTGSSGFIGRATREKLQANHQVIFYDLPQRDLLDSAQLKKSAHECDIIIHCAAIANLDETAQDMYHTHNVNITGTFRIMETAKNLGIPVVYISTCCVYGDQKGQPTDENTPPNPMEFYARSKLAGEIILRELDDWTFLRLGTVYGPGMRPALFNWKVLDAMHCDKMFDVYGDGTAGRNYIYIDDLVDAITKTAEAVCYIRKDFAEAHEDFSGEILNLCGDWSIDLDTVVRTAETVTGKVGIYTKVGPRALGDTIENISNYKAKVLLDWEPKTDYLVGMKKTYEWYQLQNSGIMAHMRSR